MLLRYAASTIGRSARALPKPYIQVSPFRQLNLKPNLGVYTQIPTQTRLSSTSGSDHGITFLPPPWQLEDLRAEERRAYQTYGPKYIKNMSSKAKAEMKRSAECREKVARLLKARYGEEWYPIMKEANAMRNVAQMELIQRLKDARARLALAQNELSDAKKTEDTEARVALAEQQVHEEQLALEARIQEYEAWQERKRAMTDELRDEIARSRGIAIKPRDL